MTIEITEYERVMLLGILEDFITEYGSKDWSYDSRLGLLDIIRSLGASDEFFLYVGGIFK